MTNLYTVAYPEISAAHHEFIEQLRSQHDSRLYAIIPAHFTFVFKCNAISEAVYLDHVAGIARQSHPIAFHCKYAMLGADDENESGYVFLVPDEGYAHISLLHDALYTGPLAPHLRLDVPYTPHITVATCPTRLEAKHLCDRLNQQGVSIQGCLTTLHVGSIDDGKFQHHAEFPLRNR